MPIRFQRWMIPCFVLVATGVGVFVLPFFFPPAYFAGVSVANVAGFNNKVAAVAAAVLSVFVFLAALRWHWLETRQEIGEYGRLSRPMVLITAGVFTSLLSLISFLVARSHILYPYDAGYFIHQIGMHADYGRKLYEQIEFPYGPLIFYGPIAIRSILSPFHVSLTAAYYTTLVLEHITGLLLVAYVLNALPMLRKWKTLLFLLCALGTLQACLGLNYTFFRFIMGPSFLVLAARRRQPWEVALCFLVGEMVSLSLSPEIAFAFGASSFVYALYFCSRNGRAWLIAAVAPFVGTVAFLLLIDRSYLLMLKLFARGVLNLVVEPIPHILIFLFALVWLVPCALALFFRQQRPEAPLLTALYIFSLALLPVTFGRADPIHAYFNGLMIFFLSMVAISSFRPRQQTLWAVCITGLFLWTPYLSSEIWFHQWSMAIPYGIFHDRPIGLKHAAVVFAHTGSLTAAEQSMTRFYEERSFDIGKLHAITGNDPVATPLEVPLYVEEDLKRSGQYTPSYYDSMIAVLDSAAEDRAIQELNASRWALLPKGAQLRTTETPDKTRVVLGLQITYPAKHTPYVVGPRFNENIVTQWQPYGEVGAFEVYRRR